ncbi:MAG: alpha/beta fold hydrolase [Acidobacteria bacterium]|nr:alpha/beta fold hydrolase [Acidobacteriota bacterium]
MIRSPRPWLNAFLLVPLALAAAGDVSPPAARFHQQAIVVDTHVDTPQRLLDEAFDLAPRDPRGHIDLPRMKEGGLDAAFMSIYADMRRYQGDAATKRALELIDTVYEQVARHPDQLLVATSAADVRRAHQQGKVALLMGMEGGTPIVNDLRLLRNFHRLGVRYLTLTHSLANDWADSSTDPPRHNGLTDFGKEVVREMNRLGMLVDISHVSDKTFWDALEVSQAPLIASHSSCRALTNHARNMTDDMIRALAAKGGVIQITFVPGFIDQDYADAFAKIADQFWPRYRALAEQYKDDPVALEHAVERLEAEYNLPPVSWERIVEHIDHAVKLVGPDHVGLGSDFDGAPMPDGMDDASYLPRLTQALLDRGYSEVDIKKILGGNTLRVLDEAQKVAARLSTVRTVSFPTQDGGIVYADAYGEGDRGVVLAHGGRFKKESWEKQARELADAGFRVLAIDFRGYGQSRGPGQSDPLSAPLHFDVLAAVRYLRKAGAKTVSVVGGSMGGGAAADASVEGKPGEIDRLVLLAHSAIKEPERMQGRKLFITSRDDSHADGSPRLVKIREQFERAPEPKELVILDGSAHAQFMFETDQRDRLVREILRFLSEP